MIQTIKIKAGTKRRAPSLGARPAPRALKARCLHGRQSTWRKTDHPSGTPQIPGSLGPCPREVTAQLLFAASLPGFQASKGRMNKSPRRLIRSQARNKKPPRVPSAWGLEVGWEGTRQGDSVAKTLCIQCKPPSRPKKPSRSSVLGAVQAGKTRACQKGHCRGSPQRGGFEGSGASGSHPHVPPRGLKGPSSSSLGAAKATPIGARATGRGLLPLQLQGSCP